MSYFLFDSPLPKEVLHRKSKKYPDMWEVQAEYSPPLNAKIAEDMPAFIKASTSTWNDPNSLGFMYPLHLLLKDNDAPFPVRVIPSHHSQMAPEWLEDIRPIVVKDRELMIPWIEAKLEEYSSFAELKKYMLRPHDRNDPYVAQMPIRTGLYAARNAILYPNDLASWWWAIVVILEYHLGGLSPGTPPIDPLHYQLYERYKPDNTDDEEDDDEE